MTLHVYHCETVTIRSERVKRNKSEGVFHGLRLHMNTDQAITFWSRTEEGLMAMAVSLADTMLKPEPVSDASALPGQMSH